MSDLRQAAQQALEAYDKTAMNSFVQNLYDEKMQEGKHGHYETMFHVVHEAVKRFAPPQQQAEPVAFYDFNKGFYWAKPTRIVAPTVVDVPPIPLYTTAAQREWAGLTDEDWEKVSNRKNTVLDTFEQGAVWAAYKLEKRNK